MASNSQETLVDDSQFHFRFSEDNPMDTTISSPSGRALYRVSTSFTNGTVILVETADGSKLAALHWSEIGLSKIAVGTDKPVRMGKVLHSRAFFSE